MKIRQCFLELQLKMSGMFFFETHCILRRLYLNELLLALSAAQVDFYVGSNYVGALAYADDLILIAPSAALRKILAICDVYASSYWMNFNAEKFKCMLVLSM